MDRNQMIVVKVAIHRTVSVDKVEFVKNTYHLILLPNSIDISQVAFHHYLKEEEAMNSDKTVEHYCYFKVANYSVKSVHIRLTYFYCSTNSIQCSVIRHDGY